MALTDNLVAYWKFNEGTGTSVADATGNGNTGTTHGSPTWGTGPVSGEGNLSYVSGSSQYTDLGSNADLVIGLGSFAIMTWAVNLSTATGSFLLASRTGSAANGYDILVADSNVAGKGNFRVYGGSTAFQYATVYSYPTTGNVQFICNVDHSAGVMEVFVNGSSVGTCGGPVATNITNTQNPRVASRATTYSTVKVGSLAMWQGRILTSTEVTQLYNGGSGLAYPFTAPSGSLFRTPLLNGLGSGGPFFSNPLGRSMVGWRPSLIIPRRAFA